jgi:hypothetical protein
MEIYKKGDSIVLKGLGTVRKKWHTNVTIAKRKELGMGTVNKLTTESASCSTQRGRL